LNLARIDYVVKTWAGKGPNNTVKGGRKFSQKDGDEEEFEKLQESLPWANTNITQPRILRFPRK